ncbi:MAG: hypothetical protein VX874_06970 [Pseudomonadota bacterium]|nr:hypothetical protein [Pseudomonadota bacterium]
MKTLITLAAAGLPGAALAHPGHAEMPGPMGHDIAHLVIGLGLATAIAVVVKVVRTRKEE